MLRRFLADQSGAAAIEYGLICALIALAILAALNTTGEQLVASLTLLLNAFK
jgi:pilus assembly protein Flp/PilA